MERFRENSRSFLTLIFSASLASLSFEIALLRIFSISLWYHFAFMVISIAMLGIAASGTVLAIFPGMKDIRRVPCYGLMLAISIPASYLLANAVPFDPARLSWDRLQLLAISLYYIILCIPFFCFGLIVSTAYAARSEQANAIYASDLLGAGGGALATLKRRETVRTGPDPLRALSYFALLGIGYLFVELAFIQKMALSLENPSYAASTVIASILISSGIGSLLSLRVAQLKTPRVLLILAGATVVYSLLLPVTMAATIHHPLLLKTIISFVLLMPAGILMGIPFPLGISLLHAAAPRLIPWAWAVNGCFSVLAPVLAVMFALSAGFRSVLFIGAAMYFIAFWVLRRELKTAG